MINPAKASENTDDDFIVCDIENWPDGRVIHIGTSWRHYGIQDQGQTGAYSVTDSGTTRHRVDTDWNSWWNFIRIEGRKHRKFRRIFAHNGGGWDWVSFAEFLIKNREVKTESISIARAMSKMIVMKVVVGDRYTIQFCDSLYLLRSSLSDLSKVFLKSGGKIDLKDELPHETFLRNKDEYFAYLERDCLALLMVLEKALEVIRKIAPIKSLGNTIGSTAMNVFRTGFLKSPISIPEGKEEKAILRRAYRGGRVEVFQYGYHRKISVYDINSLYPHAMVSVDLPISGRMVACSVYRNICVGVYTIKFCQTRRDIPPIFLVDGNGSYEGEGCYFSPEISLFNSLKAGHFSCSDGYIFSDVGRPFDDFVFSLYKLRQDNPGNAIALLAKYLLNSLYGKMGQNAVRESIYMYNDDAAKIDALAKLRPDPDTDSPRNRKMHDISADGLIVAVEEKTEVTFEHVGIAGIITSQARVLLYRMILEAGEHNVVYSDTDSVHCYGSSLDRFVGPNLGQVKVEAIGEAVYCGKKLYALRENKSGKTKVRAKGVSVGGRNGCSLDFDDMVAIAGGSEIECEFSQPASILDVLKGKDTSCRIGTTNGGHNRHRKLRLT